MSGAADAGAVNVFAGSPGGLQGGSRTVLQANSEPGDRFGAALAASLFDIGDSTADLAVGAPGEDAASPAFPGQPSRPLPDTGAVTVFYGSSGGLAGAGQVLLPIGRQAGDALGSALAPVFDQRSDPSSYLAAGGPGADLANAHDVGKVEIFVRRTSRLSSTSFTRQQGDNGIPGALEAGDRFGAALAAGPLRGPIAGLAEADLAVGAPGEDVGSLADAGTVTVLEGAPDPDPGATVLYQGRAGIPGAAEAGDRFGAALAVGPLDGGQEHDLAVGAPGEDVGADADAGAVTVVRGTPGGLTSAGSRLLVQANPEAGDRLGAAVAAGDLDGDGVAELAAGAPGENVDRAVDAGAVELFDGGVRRLLHQGLLGSLPESGDAFATAVVAG